MPLATSQDQPESDGSPTACLQHQQPARVSLAGHALEDGLLLGLVAALDDHLKRLGNVDFMSRVRVGRRRAARRARPACRSTMPARRRSRSRLAPSNSASTSLLASAMPASGSCRASSLAASLLVEVQHQHGHFRVRRGFGAEVAVDQFQRSVGQFPGQQRAGIADLRQHAAQGVLLGRRMRPPVLRVRPQLARLHPAKLFDSIADLHADNPFYKWACEHGRHHRAARGSSTAPRPRAAPAASAFDSASARPRRPSGRGWPPCCRAARTCPPRSALRPRGRIRTAG